MITPSYLPYHYQNIDYAQQIDYNYMSVEYSNLLMRKDKDMKKKILALVLCAAMLMTTACAKKTETFEETVSVVEETTSTPEETTVVETEVEEPVVEGLYEEGEEPEDYDYKVVVEINPTLLLYMKLNENGEAYVKGYSYGNEDAKDAYKEVCFTNMTAEAALNLAVTTAAEKNYLKENGTVSICLAPVSEIEPVPEELVDEYNKMGHVIVKNLESVNANIEAKSFDFEGKEVYLAPEVVEEEVKEVAKDTNQETTKTTTSKNTTSTKKDTSTGATNTEPANTPATNTPVNNTPTNNTPSTPISFPISL